MFQSVYFLQLNLVCFQGSGIFFRVIHSIQENIQFCNLLTTKKKRRDEKRATGIIYSAANVPTYAKIWCRRDSSITQSMRKSKKSGSLYVTFLLKMLFAIRFAIQVIEPRQTKCQTFHRDAIVIGFTLRMVETYLLINHVTSKYQFFSFSYSFSVLT